LTLALLYIMTMDIYRHFQQYFNYIVAINFIGGGNWNTW